MPDIYGSLNVDDLTEVGEDHYTYEYTYPAAAVVAALIGAFWGIKVAIGLDAGTYNLAPTGNVGYTNGNVFAGGSTIANAYGAARTGALFGDAIPSVSGFTSTTNATVGQRCSTNIPDGGFDADVFETLLEFNTLLQAGRTISSATLSIFVSADASTTNFVVSAKARDYGISITDTDFVAGGSLSASPEATINTSAVSAGSSFTLTGSLASVTNAAGMTRFIIYSDRTQANTQPADGVQEVITLNPSSCRLNITVV